MELARQPGTPVANQFPAVEPPGATRIAIVGEAPGRDEDYQGVPFVGESGRLLDSALGRVGLARNQCFVGNVCQHRPGEDNDFARLKWDGPEVQDGIKQLRDDLEKFNPTMVLALGNAALHLFKHGNVAPGRDGWEYAWPSKISDWRGSLGWSEGFDVKFMATWHPAAVARDYGLQGYYIALPRLVGDLERLRTEAPDRELELPACRVGVVGRDHTLDEGIAALAMFEQEARLVSFDLEGGCGNVTCLAFSRSSGSALVFPLAHIDGTSVWSENDEVRVWAAVKSLLENPRVPKLAQNGGKYDFYVLAWSYGIVVQGYDHDTMQAWWELFPELSKSLATQCSLLTKQPFYKPDKEDGELKFASDDEFWGYNGLDAARTFECLERELALMTPGQRAHYDWNMRLMPALMYMELRGFGVSKEVVGRLRVEATAGLLTYQAKIDAEQCKLEAGGPLERFRALAADGWSDERAFAKLVLERLGGKNPRVRREVVMERWQPMKLGGSKKSPKWGKNGKILTSIAEPDRAVEGPEPAPGCELWLKPMPKTIQKLFPVEPARLDDIAPHVLKPNQEAWSEVKRTWKEIKHAKRTRQVAVDGNGIEESDDRARNQASAEDAEGSAAAGEKVSEATSSQEVREVPDQRIRSNSTQISKRQIEPCCERVSSEKRHLETRNVDAEEPDAKNQLHREDVGERVGRLKDLSTRLSLALNLSVNIGSNAEDGDTQRFLYDTCGLPRVFKHVKTGRLSKESEADTKRRAAGQKTAVPAGKKVSTDQGALDKLYADTQDERALWVLQLRRLRKALQDLDVEVDPDGRIRCSLTLVKDTGRMAAAKATQGTGTNLMAWNKDLRKVCVADEGRDLYRFDLEGADSWTVAAELAALGDDTMLEDLRARLKPAKVLCVAYLRPGNLSSREEIKAKLKELEPGMDAWIYPGAKSSIHGSSYGAGWATIKDTVLKYSLADLPLDLSKTKPIVLSKAQVEAFQGAALQRYQLKRWHEAEGKAMMKRGFIETSPGHIRMFYGRKAEWDARVGRNVPCHETLKQWLADKPQFYTTYALKMALWRLWSDEGNRTSEGDLLVEPLLCVHDSLDMQVAEELRGRAPGMIKAWFDNPLEIAGQMITIPAEGKRGKDWGLEDGEKL